MSYYRLGNEFLCSVNYYAAMLRVMSQHEESLPGMSVDQAMERITRKASCELWPEV